VGPFFIYLFHVPVSHLRSREGDCAGWLLRLTRLLRTENISADSWKNESRERMRAEEIQVVGGGGGGGEGACNELLKTPGVYQNKLFSEQDNETCISWDEDLKSVLSSWKGG